MACCCATPACGSCVGDCPAPPDVLGIDFPFLFAPGSLLLVRDACRFLRWATCNPYPGACEDDKCGPCVWRGVTSTPQQYWNPVDHVWVAGYQIAAVDLTLVCYGQDADGHSLYRLGMGFGAGFGYCGCTGCGYAFCCFNPGSCCNAAATFKPDTCEPFSYSGSASVVCGGSSGTTPFSIYEP